MLYCGYRVECVSNRFVAAIAKASPLKKILCGQVNENSLEIAAIRRRYGDGALEDAQP